MQDALKRFFSFIGGAVSHWACPPIRRRLRGVAIVLLCWTALVGGLVIKEPDLLVKANLRLLWRPTVLVVMADPRTRTRTWITRPLQLVGMKMVVVRWYEIRVWRWKAPPATVKVAS